MTGDTGGDPERAGSPEGADLDLPFLQEVCGLVAGELPGVTVSFTGEGGRIVASSARERVGDLHEGAARVMGGEVEELEVTAEMAARSPTMREGITRPIVLEGRRVACLALAAPLPVARAYANIVRHWVLSSLRAKREGEKRREHLAQVERQFRDVLDFCPAALSVTDEDGRLVFHNRRLREILRYPKEEMDGIDTRRFWPDLDERQRIIDTLRSRGGQIRDQEVRYRTRDGEPVSALVSYTQLAGRGDRISFAGAARVAWIYDITALRRAEAARRASEQRLVDAIESVQEGFALFDGEDRLVVCNDHYRELYPGVADIIVPGVPYAVIARAAAERGVIRDAVGRVDAWLERRLALHREPSGPHLQAQGDGRWIQIDERKTRDGGTVAVFTDVTGLKRAERALLAAKEKAEEASRAKTEFLAAMSHEIRTPLTVVLGMADLLAAEGPGGEQRGRVEAIRTSGRHLLSVVNDILDFSRIEAGGLELERIDFALADVLDQVRSLTAPQAAERGLELRLAYGGYLPPVVRGDPTRLAQVLLNLVGNGLKFTHRGGVTVHLGSRPEGGGRFVLRFEVRDTGIGMTPGQVAGLFRPFAQADRSTTRRYGGSGLGLAISRRLVEAMGGRIGAESVPGRGSLFWFEVPLERGDAAATSERTGLDPAAVPPMRVLVAEDAEATRRLLGGMLGRHGHAVSFARDGAEAVGLVARERFDAVLMDVRMPVVDGIEATRRIRGLPPPAGRVPIVGLTANVAASERERYLAAGMDDCLAKPVEWGRLFAALARFGEALARPVEPPAGAGAREEPPEASRGAGAGGTPLLDRASLDRLVAGLPAEEAADLLRQAVDDAGLVCASLGSLPASLEGLLDEAHKLRGVAGFLGLAGIGAVAGEVEAAARGGGNVSGLAERLAGTVAATRAALREAGLLAG